MQSMESVDHFKMPVLLLFVCGGSRLSGLSTPQVNIKEVLFHWQHYHKYTHSLSQPAPGGGEGVVFLMKDAINATYLTKVQYTKNTHTKIYACGEHAHLFSALWDGHLAEIQLFCSYVTHDSVNSTNHIASFNSDLGHFHKWS